MSGPPLPPPPRKRFTLWSYWLVWIVALVCFIAAVFPVRTELAGEPLNCGPALFYTFPHDPAGSPIEEFNACEQAGGGRLLAMWGLIIATAWAAIYHGRDYKRKKVVVVASLR